MSMTESEMREATVPWIKEADELTAYIKALVDQQHDYGTAVYATSMAAVAAYKYVAGVLGITGFQAGCADMDIIRRNKGMERFILLDLSNALYPQYDLPARLEKALEDVGPWLAEQAREKLNEGDYAHPNVVSHWRKLAAAHPAATVDQEPSA